MSFRVRVDKTLIDALQKKLSDLPRAITKADASTIGSQILATMKSLISTGTSPIRGYGKFPAYKNPKSYPGKRKAHTPVNLKLSGDFLSNLTARVISSRFGYSMSIGYDGALSQQKEQGHRDGVNSQPSRPTIPQIDLGERFHAKIEEAFMKGVREAVTRVARRR